jgi:hypothetical protein
MATKPQRGIGFRFASLASLVWLAWSSNTGLRAQDTYTSSTGKTSIFSYYDPNAPAPAPKAPVVNPTPFPLPFLPAIPMERYLAQKAEIAQYSQSSFAFPSQVEIHSAGPAPRAPGAPTAVASNPTFSWQGLPDTGLEPPSPDIAAGPNDVLMVVNSNIGQFTKSGTLKKLTSFQNWFGDVLSTVCPFNCFVYDPWIAYDQLHGRFLFLASAAPANPNARTSSYLLLSVSNGPTYDGGWKNWAMNASLDGNVQTLNWGDFWHLGFDNVAIYLSGNMFNVSANFQYAKVRVLKKADVYNPAATALPYQEIGSATAKLQNADCTLADSLVPAHLRGKPTTAALFVNALGGVAGPNCPVGFQPPATGAYLTVWKIADPLAAPLTMTQSTVNGLSYTMPAAAPQLGTSATLDTNDTRVLKAIYRGGFLYTARNTGYTDQATTVTYDVIDTSSMKIGSQARLLNANTFYPAFDVPATTPLGNQFAIANVITGTTTAPNGTLTYAGLSNNLKAGESSFDVNFGGKSRWGDYFGGAVDPVSGGLWVSGEYAKPSIAGFGQWGTWAGYYPWLTTPAFTDVPSSSGFFDYVNVLSSWQITSGCSANPPLFCPTDLVTRDQLATLIIRSMLGDTFTYSTIPYYTDVPASSPFFRYIQKLTDLGISHGCTATTFCPGGTVPRMDASVLLVRGKLISLFGDKFTYPATPFFTDVPATLPQFPYIQKLYELGLTGGCSSTQFCPNSLLTRQEIAVFLTRAFLN